MSKKLIGALIACLAFVFTASAVTAQEPAKKAEKKADKKGDKKADKADKAYKGGDPFTSPKGYTISPPAGWTIVSAYMTEAQLKELPAKVREQFRPEQIDVLFMDQSAQKTGSAFGDNLNVVVIAEVVPLDDKTVAELKMALSAQYAQVFEGFKMTEFAKTSVGGKPALRIQGTYKLNEHDLHLHQTFMPGKSNSLVLTCTMDRARVAERTPLCEGAAASVSFK